MRLEGTMMVGGAAALVVGAAAVLGLGPEALAQTEARAEQLWVTGSGGGELKPIVVTVGEGDVESTKEVTSVVDGVRRSVRVQQSGGDVRVFVNGEELFSGDAAGDWEMKEIRGADDEVVVRLVRGDAEATFFPSGARKGIREIELRAPGQGGWFVFERDGDRPKVMLGVTMHPPEDSVADQLGVDPASTTQIGGVMEGLPAEAAGLRKHDVIVGVDGSSEAGPDAIRAALKEKEPGDTLTLEVLRDGERRVVTATLAAYDGERLGVNVERRALAVFKTEEMRSLREELRSLIDERESLRESLRGAEGQRREELRARLDETRERVDVLRERIAAGGADALAPMGSWSPGSGGRLFVPRAPEAPGAPGAPMKGVSSRWTSNLIPQRRQRTF